LTLRAQFVGIIFAGLVTASRGEAQVRDTILIVVPDTIVAHQAPADTSRRPLRLCAGGDITLGSNLDPRWQANAEATLWQRFNRRADPDSLLAPVRPFFSGADVVLVNIEGAIGDGPAPKKCGPRSTSCFAFRQPPTTAAALRRLGGDSARVVGNVANNHSHDAGVSGFGLTQALLDSAGVIVTGVDTLATPVVTDRGDTIAVLGFYTGSGAPDARDVAAVQRHVARAVAHYRTVVVTMHLGAEGAKAQRTRNATEAFAGTNRGNPISFAHAALAGGATAVIGHGPHVLRAGEWRDSGLVLYSLGNLVNYGTFGLGEPMNHGAVACMSILAPGKVVDARIGSTLQVAPGVVFADTLNRSARLIDSLSDLDFPSTGIVVGVDGAIGRRLPAQTAPGGSRRPPR
jgi:poly-gamma-glutamate capsule biosynthesis protein CapA/YwtB (metallophosphatase superfamily)